MIELPPIPDKEFFSIGEASRIVQVPAYVLRYWENEFKVLRPVRRTSGQRKYTRKELELIFQVKDLLYIKKFTIAGAKKYLLGDKRRKEDSDIEAAEIKRQNIIEAAAINEIKNELEDLLKLLK